MLCMLSGCTSRLYGNYIFHEYYGRYAKQEKYTKAIEDFKRALKLDPQHANAATYLEMTRRKSKEVEREKESAARGEFLMVCTWNILIRGCNGT